MIRKVKVKDRVSPTLGDLYRGPEMHFKSPWSPFSLVVTLYNMSAYTTESRLWLGIFPYSYPCTKVWALRVRNLTSLYLHIWAAHGVEKVSGGHCMEGPSRRDRDATGGISCSSRGPYLKRLRNLSVHTTPFPHEPSKASRSCPFYEEGTASR